MLDAAKPKDVWDILSAVTPLVLGLAVTGVGAFFTQVYNFRQLRLTQIEALDKLRTLLISTKPEEREFGYAAFAALGYEQMAIRVIRLSKDQSGRPVLLSIAETGDPNTKAKANDALQTLDKAREPVAAMEGLTPEELAHQDRPFEDWVEKSAHELGITSALGKAILLDTAFHMGQSAAEKFKVASSKLVPFPLGTKEEEKAWLTEFLRQRDSSLRGPLKSGIFVGIDHRLETYRTYLKNEDWDLVSLHHEDADTK